MKKNFKSGDLLVGRLFRGRAGGMQRTILIFIKREKHGLGFTAYVVYNSNPKKIGKIIDGWNLACFEKYEQLNDR